MPTVKLTKNEIAKLPAPNPGGKPAIYWDTSTHGLGVLVSGTTTGKSYVVQHTMQDGKTRRITIAPTNVLELEGPEGARARAQALLALFWAGIDPKAEKKKASEQAKRQARGTPQLVLDDYVDSKPINADTRAYYRRMIEQYLADWLDKPMREISYQMVAERHADIAAKISERNFGKRLGGGPTTGQTTANAVMQVLTYLWKWASKPHRMPEIGPNPVGVLEDQWFKLKRRSRLVKGDDLPAFYQAVDGLPSRTSRDYILLLLFTGLRRREAASLRWSDIDFAARIIRLPAERTKAKRKLDLPMSSFVRDLLVARRAIGRDGDFVFAANSKSGHVEDAEFALGEVAKAGGVKVAPMICAAPLSRTPRGKVLNLLEIRGGMHPSV